MARTNMTVRCMACGEWHYTDEVEFLNVEEDMQGRDNMTFVCPETGEKCTSLVFEGYPRDDDDEYEFDAENEYDDDWDGQPDEAQEWHDFDPDC